MNTIKDIKVTATYNKAENSKIDALLTEFEISKKIADTTEETLKPVITACGEEKLRCIVEQLKPLQVAFKRFTDVYGWQERLYVTFAVDIFSRNCVEIKPDDICCDGMPLLTTTPHSCWFETDGWVTKWSNKHLETLEKDFEAMVESAIGRQQKRVAKVQENLAAIQK